MGAESYSSKEQETMLSKNEHLLCILIVVAFMWVSYLKALSKQLAKHCDTPLR